MSRIKMTIVIVVLVAFLAGCRGSASGDFTYPPYDGSRVMLAEFKKQYSWFEYQDLLYNSYLPSWFVSYDQVSFLGEFVKYELVLVKHGEPIERTHENQVYYLRGKDGSEFQIKIVHSGGGTDGIERVKRAFEDLKKDSLEMPEMENFLYPESKMKCCGDYYGKYYCKGLFYGYSHINKLQNVAWFNDEAYIEITLFHDFMSDGVEYDYPESGFGAIDALFAPETAKYFVNKVNVATLAPYYAKEYWPVFVLSAVVISLLAMFCVMVIKIRRKKQSATTVDDELREILS